MHNESYDSVVQYSSEIKSPFLSKYFLIIANVRFLHSSKQKSVFFNPLAPTYLGDLCLALAQQPIGTKALQQLLLIVGCQYKTQFSGKVLYIHKSLIYYVFEYKNRACTFYLYSTVCSFKIIGFLSRSVTIWYLCYKSIHQPQSETTNLLLFLLCLLNMRQQTTLVPKLRFSILIYLRILL